MSSHCVHGQAFVVHKDNQAFITLFFCVSCVEVYDAGLPLKTFFFFFYKKLKWKLLLLFLRLWTIHFFVYNVSDKVIQLSGKSTKINRGECIL